MKNTKCKLCGNEECTHLYNGIDRFCGIEGDFDIYKCNTCGLIFISPVLEGEELSKYYPNTYYSYNSSDKDLGDVKIQPLTLKDKILFYLRHPLKAINCLLYSKLLKQKDLLSYKEGLKVLDIGCGDGKYLLAKEQQGCKCFGIDISEDALRKLENNGQDIGTYCGDIWEAPLEDESFDIVNLDNVIEHIAEPEKLLNEIRRVMKKDAILKVVLPNAGSVTHKIFRKYWMGLDCPRHLYTYSIGNLKMLFKKTKFKSCKYRTIENSYDLVCSMIYVFSACLRRKVKVMELSSIWDSELLKLLFSPYSLLVNIFKVGDSVEVILQKDEKE